MVGPQRARHTEEMGVMGENVHRCLWPMSPTNLHLCPVTARPAFTRPGSHFLSPVCFMHWAE